MKEGFIYVIAPILVGVFWGGAGYKLFVDYLNLGFFAGLLSSIICGAVSYLVLLPVIDYFFKS